MTKRIRFLTKFSMVPKRIKKNTSKILWSFLLIMTKILFLCFGHSFHHKEPRYKVICFFFCLYFTLFEYILQTSSCLIKVMNHFFFFLTETNKWNYSWKLCWWRTSTVYVYRLCFIYLDYYITINYIVGRSFYSLRYMSLSIEAMGNEASLVDHF